MSPLARALTAYPDDTRTLVVAYSGGRDSTALLHVLAESRPVQRLRAVHVCHHIEREAEHWATHCEQQCRALGVAYTRCDVQVDSRSGGLEAAAREARYTALAQCLAEGEVLVTAHHADDQAETFLLQALRGAGVTGLAAMPALAPLGAGRLWRPWLGLARAEIADWADARQLSWIEDQSNHDPGRARSYLRTRIWPALSAHWPAANRTLARSAAWAGRAAAAIDALAEIDLEAARAPGDALAIEPLVELGEARCAEVLRRWLRGLGRDRADHRHLAEIERLLVSREHGGPCVAFAHTEVRRFDGRLFAMPRLALAPPADTRLAWSSGAPPCLPTGCGQITIHPTRWPVWPDELYIGFGRPGDRLAGAEGRGAALSEYLRRWRVPPWIRQRMPRIYVGDTLIAVPGWWQHPGIAAWFGGRAPRFVWQHDLVGAAPV